jgi:uncharacterized protein (TIGR02145 family)
MKPPRLFLLSLNILVFTGVILIQSSCKKENEALTCTIIYPGNGENIPHGTVVTISVDAVDADGSINVNFYVDHSSIGISNRAPYNYDWNTLDYVTGRHSIQATATHFSDQSTSNEIGVTLTEGIPIAEFAVYQTSVCPDSAAQFYNRSINNPESWLWDFGDGGTSDLQNPSHTYPTVGSYTVSLTVTNRYGSDTENKTGLIRVTDPLTDYDGHVYQTVQIGNQLWMRENLKTTHYADGTALVDGTGTVDITGDYTTKYYFAYNDDENYVDVHGRLYTWAAAMNGAESSETNPGTVQGVCPVGWHVPSDDEWMELERHLGMPELEVHGTYWRGTNEGLILRESGSSHWWDYIRYISGTNESGFTALPGGSRGYNGSFRDLKERANYWSATESLSSHAWARRLYYNHPDVYRYDDYKSRAYSIRCIKD